ncbi:MAG: type II secretion system protein [bacterium]
MKKNKGFTIIETMISISIFIVVVMIGMNSLLNASFIHQKNRDQREIMDNLTFIMEEMSRNIRTGYDYSCSPDSGTLPAVGYMCSTSLVNMISFNPAESNARIMYYIDEDPNTNSSIGIFRSTGNGISPVNLLNNSEIALDSVKSGFIVTGAAPSTDTSNPDYQQPLVTIRLVGKITTKGVDTPFSIQTTVSQRNPDQ